MAKRRYTRKRQAENQNSEATSDSETNETVTDKSAITKVKKVYNIGDVVCCYHGEHPYAAKCMNIRTKNGQMEYLVHYIGWKKSWDQWVMANRVLEYNDDNMKKTAIKGYAPNYKSKFKTNDVPKKESTPESSIDTPVCDNNSSARDLYHTPISSTSAISIASTSGSASRIRRKRLKKEGDYEHVKYHQFELHVPVELFYYVEKVIHQVLVKKRTIKIPAKCNVDRLTEMFITCSARNSNNKQEFMTLKLFAFGVRTLFDKICISKLLLDVERERYNQLLKDNSDLVPSSVYGIAHLCRLFLHFGEVLRYISLNNSNMQCLQHYSSCYIAFLLNILDI